MSLRAVSLICLLLLIPLPLTAQTPEHRGLWVPYDSYDTPQYADTLIQLASTAGINVLYPLVWYNGGQAWFRSSMSPMAERVPAGFDPLGHLITLARARGMEVHPWFVAGQYGRPPSKGGLLEQHPDWALQASRASTEQWYDLAKPPVRDFIKGVMLECLRTYDVQGLHFDYIRYSGQVTCVCDYCRTEFTRRTGQPPAAAAPRFPAALETSGNPLQDVTTAQVLAVFDDGLPAVTLNRLGQGRALLLNWNASRPSCPATEELLIGVLKESGAAQPGKLYQLQTSESTAKYGAAMQTTATAWFKRLGFTPQMVDEGGVSQVPADGTVLLFSQYLIPAETAAWLERFVTGGGYAVFIDGPSLSIQHEPLQRVVGLRAAGRYFRTLRVISPAAGQDLIAGGPELDLAQERRRAAQWVQWRRENVTDLVRDVYREAKQVKPQAKVSAAVFRNRAAADAVCQDWYGWLKAGIIDYVVPMAYLMTNQELQKDLDEYKAADPAFARIIPGLSDYWAQGKGGSRTPELVVSQIELCRQAGARGTVIFSSRNLSQEIAAAMGAGPHATPAPVYYPPARP